MKDIPGYEGLYAITKRGRVWSYRRKINNKDGRTRIIGGRYLKPCLNQTGYYAISLSDGIKKSSYLLHRLIALTYIPKVDGKDFINHIDGVKTNNKISNLEWCTRSENVLHAEAHGLMRHPKGEDSGTSKVTEEQVREIRRRFSEGEFCYKIAEDFPLGKSAVNYIANGTTWKHLL